ncbi:MAG: DUF1972 domain-containing protein [Bacteroidales bacterium]|nr:DUF1972 domain-containing protein [Bacteroidales bacterium]MBN2749288.1 DUF1972 domain-containing protein [Bacteroidales bacterium]
MKVAILGTRGIPNRYGGFERFAEVLSAKLAHVGVDVWVFCPCNKSAKAFRHGNVWVLPVATPWFLPSQVQTLLYDLLSLVKAKQMGFHVLLECGYGFAPWLLFFGKQTRKRVVVNMDGLEYTREKWGLVASLYLRFCEYCAVKLTRNLVVDSREIGSILYKKYSVNTVFIPYGADTCNEPKVKVGVPEKYCLAIARITPENSIKQIANAAILAKIPIVIVGSIDSGYGKMLYEQYSQSKLVHFYGAAYNQDELNALRLGALLYIHGHTVGGTNPSLLEAMACGCVVVAHNNLFNREVLGSAGFYFSSTEELSLVIKNFSENEKSLSKKSLASVMIVNERYCWSSIANDYLQLFEKVASNLA